MQLGTTITAFYWIVCTLLTVLGVYRLALLVASIGVRGRRPDVAAPPHDWPRVTVQLPLYNERWVVRRLLESVARLDYPLDRLQIQILDDSTDRTSVLVERMTRRLRRCGLDVEHRRRAHRDGFKAGALRSGLHAAKGELIAIFDADFVPPPDFLRRMVPHLLQPDVGVVQARWGHLNRDATWFTRLQSILLDGHFAVEQPTRCARGWLLTFNGTAGIWRRTAIEAAGGWQCDTLTEDLDLSFRAQLAGWRVRYVADVVVPAELPVDSDSLRAQQRRWTQGGVQVARKLLPRIVRARLPWHVKLEAVLHLTSYVGYPLLVLLALLRTPARIANPDGVGFGLLPGETSLLVLGTLPLVAFYTLAQRAAGSRGGVRRWVRDAFPAMALGAGLSLSNALAVMQGLFGQRLQFDRTPKRGDSGLVRLARYRSPGLRLAGLELLLLAYLLICKVWFTQRTWLGEFPFLSFFAFGLLAMSLPSVREAWSDARVARLAPPARTP